MLRSFLSALVLSTLAVIFQFNLSHGPENPKLSSPILTPDVPKIHQQLQKIGDQRRSEMDFENLIVDELAFAEPAEDDSEPFKEGVADKPSESFALPATPAPQEEPKSKPEVETKPAPIEPKLERLASKKSAAKGEAPIVSIKVPTEIVMPHLVPVVLEYTGGPVREVEVTITPPPAEGDKVYGFKEVMGPDGEAIQVIDQNKFFITGEPRVYAIHVLAIGAERGYCEQEARVVIRDPRPAVVKEAAKSGPRTCCVNGCPRSIRPTSKPTPSSSPAPRARSATISRTSESTRRAQWTNGATNPMPS